VLLCPVQQSLIGSDALSKQEWEWGGIDEEFMSKPIRSASGVQSFDSRLLVCVCVTHSCDSSHSEPYCQGPRQRLPINKGIVREHAEWKVVDCHRYHRSGKRSL
jgi:hypothetical protein